MLEDRHDTGARMPLSRNDLLWIGAIVLVWVAAGVDILSPRLPGDNVAILWAPNAVLAVAMLRRIDRPRLIALFAGAAILSAAVPGALRAGEDPQGWAALAVANCLEAYALAWLANRIDGPDFRFHRARNVVVWSAAALVSGVVSMLLAWGATAAGLGPLDFSSWSSAAAHWILGNASAHFTLGALLVELTARGRWAKLRRGVLDVERPALMTAAVLASALVAFAGPRLWSPADLTTHPGYLALILPALMWVAFNYGPAAASASTLLALAAGVALSVNGWGPFASQDRAHSDDLQIMILALSGATLLVGALGAYVRAARDQAAAADRLKTLFLSRVGHELRTPLNGVIGAADLLAAEMGDAPETQLERIDLVRSSARTLAAVVEDLVEFSALQREGVAIRKSAFEAAGPFADAAAIFEPQARWNNVALALQTQRLNGQWIVSDPARVRQILFALVANAVAATARGRIDIEAELDGLDGDRATLWFCVRDTGGGVKPDLAPHIFEPFVQGARDPNTPSSGLGLGLAVARETAEALGGTVRLENTPGEGAAFHVSIPVVRAKAAASADAPRRVSALLAEDNPTNRIVLSAMLTSLGFDVVSVETGAEALAAVQKRDFSIVLMDIQMPVMDGEEAIERIRALDGPRARTPILAVTAHALAGDGRRYESAGADGVLYKPVALKDLADAVARTLDQAA